MLAGRLAGGRALWRVAEGGVLRREHVLARAGRLCDGWLGQQSLDEIDADELVSAPAQMREAAVAAGRDPARLEVVLRIVQSQDRIETIARALPALAAVGVDEVIVDLDWNGDLDAQYQLLASAL